MRKGTLTIGVSLAALSIVAAACGSKSSSKATTTTEATATTEAPATTTGSATTEATATTATSGTPDLKAAGCPDPMVIQTDWFPEADHGWTYQLLGPNGTMDPKKGTYSAEVGGITITIQAGGPFISGASPAKQMYQDPSVFAAYVDTGDAIRNATTTPVVAVFAPYFKGPQIIYWDPAKYPNVKTLADVGATAGAGQIRVFNGAAYTDYLVGKGIVKKSQLDTSYDGSPSVFVAKGNLFQQGFATSEIYSYENLIDGWKKPLAYAFVHDAGFTIYQSALSVKPDTIKTHAACLKAVVPLFQQSLVDYMKDPTATNALLVKYVTAMNQFWKISDAQTADAVAKMKSLGLVTDGGASNVGSMDCTRVQKLIDEFNPIEKANNVEGVKDGLKCADIVDSEFLSPSISLGY
jgi:hypothetical protein